MLCKPETIVAWPRNTRELELTQKGSPMKSCEINPRNEYILVQRNTKKKIFLDRPKSSGVTYPFSHIFSEQAIYRQAEAPGLPALWDTRDRVLQALLPAA